jgi:hypothetical protein
MSLAQEAVFAEHGLIANPRNETVGRPSAPLLRIAPIDPQSNFGWPRSFSPMTVSPTTYFGLKEHHANESFIVLQTSSDKGVCLPVLRNVSAWNRFSTGTALSAMSPPPPEQPRGTVEYCVRYGVSGGKIPVRLRPSLKASVWFKIPESECGVFVRPRPKRSGTFVQVQTYGSENSLATVWIPQNSIVAPADLNNAPGA